MNGWTQTEIIWLHNIIGRITYNNEILGVTNEILTVNFENLTDLPE